MMNSHRENQRSLLGPEAQVVKRGCLLALSKRADDEETADHNKEFNLPHS